MQLQVTHTWQLPSLYTHMTQLFTWYQYLSVLIYICIRLKGEYLFDVHFHFSTFVSISFWFWTKTLMFDFRQFWTKEVHMLGLILARYATCVCAYKKFSFFQHFLHSFCGSRMSSFRNVAQVSFLSFYFSRFLYIF